jgi:PTS system N-acetylgalactosamine-specific IIA component
MLLRSLLKWRLKMKRIVVMGHGGYAEGVKQNLDMIVGQAEHMYFIDLTKEDDLASFENKVNNLIEGFKDDEVLFACDLLGASPFRVAAMLCVNKPGKYYTVAGLNSMAFVELSMESDLSIEQLSDRAIETTKSAVSRFPE